MAENGEEMKVSSELESGSSSNTERKLKLWCPTASRAAAIVAGEEQRLDFGYLAKVFGLDPSSLKLNGHFIGREIDLLSSSVTWKSLLNYFSARGLSTGEDDGHALVVDGKPRKAQTTKRGRSDEESGRNRSDLVADKKLKESSSNSGCDDNPQVSKSNSSISKRKQLMEDVCLLKKLKINEGNSEVTAPTIPDFGSRVNTHSGIGMDRNLKCSSYMNGNVRRTREDDEVLLTTPSKRIRWV